MLKLQDLKKVRRRKENKPTLPGRRLRLKIQLNCWIEWVASLIVSVTVQNKISHQSHQHLIMMGMIFDWKEETQFCKSFFLWCVLLFISLMGPILVYLQSIAYPHEDELFCCVWQAWAINAKAEIHRKEACCFRWALCLSLASTWLKAFQVPNPVLSYIRCFPSCFLSS